MSDLSTRALEPAIAGWMAGKLGAGEVEIVELRRHIEGFSWQTFTFRARWTTAGGDAREQGFAIRRQPEDGLLPPYDAALQFRLGKALMDTPVPVPEVFWLEPDPTTLGNPFYVMELVEGIVPVQWRPDDPRAFPTPEARHRVGVQFVDALAATHAVAIDRDGIGELDAPGGEGPALHQTRRLARLYEENLLVELPLVREALVRLETKPVESGRLALVHGDYRIGNFILGLDGRIATILDWELAHVGDPAQDVAWAGLKLFRGRSPLWSALLEEADFLALYEERTGLRIEPDLLRYWSLLGTTTTAIAHLAAARAFEDGRVDDLRLAAMGHLVVRSLRQLAAELDASPGGVA